MSNLEEMAKEFSLALRLEDYLAAEDIVNAIIVEAGKYRGEMGDLGDKLEKFLRELDWAAAEGIAIAMAKRAVVIDLANHQLCGRGFDEATLHADLAFFNAGLRL